MQHQKFKNLRSTTSICLHLATEMQKAWNSKKCNYGFNILQMLFWLSKNRTCFHLQYDQSYMNLKFTRQKKWN